MKALFEQICRELSLGTPVGDPVPLSGGYTHRMFALTTSQGRYAVKLLNPEIMARPDAPDNYARAEGFERQLEATGLPILPAMTIGGKKMQCVSGQCLYVFPFFEGRVLRDEEITPDHCALMGCMLARIHGLSRREPATQALLSEEGGPEGAGRSPDWPPLVAALLRDPESAVQGSDMHRALPMLIRVTRAMEQAAASLPRVEALCHNDMDAKNVLWRGSDFRVIDLECLGYADPRQEMLDLAISWAGWPADEKRFKAFLTAYIAAGGEEPRFPDLLYDSRRNHLDWLAYNARRALSAPLSEGGGSEGAGRSTPEGGGSKGAGGSDPEERRIGREQIEETLAKLESDQRQRDMILRWMEEVRYE